MIQTQDIRVDEFFANPVMPFGMRITHVPSCITVEGNCRSEQGKGNLHATLMNALAQFVANETPQATNGNAAQAENDMLREQLLLMQEQINAMMARGAASEPAPAPKKPAPAKAKGRKARKGWTEERRAAAADRMRAMVARRVKTPAGEQTEAELLAQQMRPPTDAPMALPRNPGHGLAGTVAKSSVGYIKP